jgi:hypothetical protein
MLSEQDRAGCGGHGVVFVRDAFGREDAARMRCPVTGLWGIGGLIWLLVTTAAYLAAGILAFRAGERAARIRGSLARY